MTPIFGGLEALLHKSRCGWTAPLASVLHGWAGCRKERSVSAPDLAFMPHKYNAARRHHIPRPKRRVTNWQNITRRCGSGAV